MTLRTRPSTRLAVAILSLTLLAPFALPFPAAADDPNNGETASLADAIRNGKAGLALRYRVESVDQDGSAKEALASTLRTTLNYRTAAYRGWSAFVEAENVADLGADDQHNNVGSGSLGNGVTDRPVIADPAQTELHQAYLRWTGDTTTVTVGRQALALGDQRFVGPVGWRQNHQSFDAFAIHNHGLDKVVFDYVFVDEVQRIFGDSKPMASHLASAAFSTGIGKVTAYGWLLDYDETVDRALSRTTLGLELAGKRNRDRYSWLYELEYATQSDAGDNPADVDAGYLHGSLGVATAAKTTFKVGWELLEGNGGADRFLTPLATLHKFNGWADKFLATPGAGLEDLYLQLSGSRNKLAWTIKAHDFNADSSSASYGSELDAQLTWKGPQGLVFGVKGAYYDADEFATDTTKLWLWSAWKL